MSQLVYCEFFFESPGNAYEAFKNIGKGGHRIFQSETIQDVKMMGAGAGNGFSILPDFRRYAILFFFKSEPDALQFVENCGQLGWYVKQSAQHLITLLTPAKGHGTWSGLNPFEYERDALNESAPVAVITRATIRTRALPDFWSNVPAVSSFMHSAPALHQVGIGEYPIFMQATFSIWQNLKSLKEVAYRDTPHAEVIKKTRERNWYKEELFAEFAIKRLSVKGDRFSRLKLLNIKSFQNTD
jgi:hypothetical protein